MAFRIHSLPPCLKQSLFAPTGFAPRCSRFNRRFSTHFFTRTAPPLGKKLLWLIPLAGGFALYVSPEPRAVWANLFTSPTLIPSPPIPPSPPVEHIILSPEEDEKTIIRRIIHFLNCSVWEPLLTARRFIFLCILFVPVFLTAPMLLVGSPDSRLLGDRWGAVWWYEFMTQQMQRAGPTFIKVCS